MAFSGLTVGPGKYLRPTGVRNRVYAGQNIAIEIIGLREAARIPEELAAAYEKMLTRMEVGLQEMARAVVPGGPDGKLGRQVHARRVSHSGRTAVVIGTIGSQFAKALNRGFTSTPKKAQALRFNESGKLVFSMRVHVAGRHFFEKWLEGSPSIVEAVYARSFYNIKEQGFV